MNVTGMYFYAQDKNRIGPVTESEIEDLIEKGKIKPMTLLWTEGLSDWQKASEFEEFKSLFKIPPPLPVISPPPIPKSESSVDINQLFNVFKKYLSTYQKPIL